MGVAYFFHILRIAGIILNILHVIFRSLQKQLRILPPFMRT